MMPPALRRVGLVAAGVGIGVFGLAMGLLVFLEAARVEQIRTEIGAEVQVARDAIEHVEVLEQDAIRFTLRDIALLDEAGEVIASAPSVLMTLDVPSFNGEGAIEFYDVELIEPTVNLLQSPDGVWNFTEVMTMTAAGEPVRQEEGRPITLRDVRIDDGDLVLAMPVAEPDGPPSTFPVNLPLTTIGGAEYQRYVVSGVEGVLPVVQVGGNEGWRVEVGDLTGSVAEPDLQIAQLQGWAEQEGLDGFRFELATLRIADSRVAGRGSVRITEEGPLYDMTIEAAPLLAADFASLFPTLPEEGSARFALDVESVSAVRHGLTFRGLDASIAGSRLTGSLGVAIGGEVPPALMAAALELAPFELLTLERLGFVEEVPFVGRVTGRVTTAGAPSGSAEVNLTGTIVPRNDPEVPPSTIFAVGNVAIGGASDPFTLDGLTLSLQPLHLASFRSFAPEQAERLRGDIRGSVQLAGTLAEVRMAGGELTYQIDEGAPTRLTNLTGRFATNPLSYTVRAVASPISLATLTELFPGLPFRSGTLSGPIELSGSAGGFDVEADLTGPSGGIQLAGSFDLGEIPTFEVSGQLRAFAAGMILRPDVPVQGPLTGTFSARGSTQQFAFDVDLAQSDGSFALIGTANLNAEPARFDVAGNVVNFRLGALLGDPDLFPDAMTGPIRVSGGGGEPYSFDVDLQGETGVLDLAGIFRPGNVPSYEVQGRVTGLDLAALPLPRPLPTSSLNGRVDIRGSGTDLESLAGSYSFDLTSSTISNLTLDQALGRIEIAGGVAAVDTLHVQLGSAVLAAAGSWGLRTPAAEPLRFAFSSPDLSELSRVMAPDELVPPILAGRVAATGEVGGSVEYPMIDATLDGRGLRYEEWRAATLDLDVDVSRDPVAGWGGQLALAGDDLVLPRLDTFETVRLEASGNESSLAVGLFARRNSTSDVGFSGILELDGLRPQGISLQTLALRAEGVDWDLLAPARLRYVGNEGLLVENLVLQSGGSGGQGSLTVNGMLPPTGNADLRVTADNIDLADLRRVSPAAPDLQGRLFMDMVLDGPVVDPALTINARLEQLIYQGVTTESVSLDLAYLNGSLTGSAEASMAGRTLFAAEMSVPTLLSMENRLIPSFQFLDEAPLAATIRADSLPLDFAAALVPGLLDGAGVARAQVDVSGTIDSPLLEGWVRVDDGAVTVEMAGARYSQIDADIRLSNNEATISSLSMVSGGTLSVSGAVAFPSVSAPVMELTVVLNDFLLMDNPEIAELNASGNLSIAGPASGPVLRGNLTIHESTIRVPEMGQEEPTLGLAYADLGQMGAIPEGDLVVPAPMMGNVRVDDFDLSFGESVWLESDDMRVQIEGALVVYRTGEELRVFGSLQALRGTYQLQLSGITREFDVIQGQVQFFGTGELDPSLDILAGYRVRSSTVGRGGDLTILVRLTGTLLAPRLQLTADTPIPLSEADLISYLMFGQPSFEIGGVFAEQVVVQEVLGGIFAAGLERPILQSGLCDWVRVRPGATSNFRGIFQGGALSNAAVECGWELANSLYLTAQASLGGLFDQNVSNGQLGLEWQIDRQWSLEASYGTVQRDAVYRIFDPTIRTQFSTDIRREWEYGLPSRRGTIDLTPETAVSGQGEPPPIPNVLPPVDPIPAP